MRSRTRMTPWAAGLVALLAVPAAVAQTPAPKAAGGPPPAAAAAGPNPTPSRRSLRGVTTPVLLIKAAAVQKELKLTAAQKDRIQEINAAYDHKRAEFARKMTEGQGKFDPQALAAIIAEVRDENEAALAQVLERSQRTRLGQIALQMEGPLAVTRPKVASRLNLDEAQLEAIQGLKWEFQLAQEQLRESQIERLRADAGRPRAARPGPGANPQPTDPSTPDRTLDEVNLRMNREADELRARLPQRLGKILTRRQRDAFNRMLGAPFDPKQAP